MGDFYLLKTLDLSLKVLRMFTREMPVWGGRELANEMNINHTNIYRILETLEKNRFVTKDPVTKKYSLGYATWELGKIMYESLNVDTLIKPSLDRLCEETGESVFLTILDRDEAVTLAAVEPENKVRFTVSAGSRSPLYVGASYRSILAFLPEEVVEKVISEGFIKYTKYTVDSGERLKEELARIRKNGWGESQGEFTPEVLAIAVPLNDDFGVIGSITVSGPIYRMTEEHKKACLPLLMKARDEIEVIIKRYNIKLKS